MRRLTLLIVLAFASTAAAAPQRAGFWAAWAMPKVWLAFLFAGLGLGLLVSGRTSRPLRLAILGISFLLWGIVPALPLGGFSRGMVLHPSPMCLVGRSIQFLSAGRAIPPMFLGLLLATALMTIAGSKLFCGWVCPIGALQELLHAVPLPKGWKRRIPFPVSNGVRVGFFAAFLVVLFGWKRYLYDYVNAFHFLEWNFELGSVLVAAVVMVAALFVFRPFCYHVCPLGLVTWVVEQLSLTKVRTAPSCTGCRRCVEASPCPSVGAIIEGKAVRPDCHACGRCIEACRSSLRWG